MKKLIFALLLVAGCAKSLPDPPVPPVILARPSIQLFTPFGFGHGCPVEGYIFTARHVVNPAPGVSSGASFLDVAGRVMPSVVVALGNAADVALLQPDDGALLTYYPRGTVEPGDTVYWWDYVQEPGRDAMRARLRAGKVLRIPGGHLVIDRLPIRGASGGCVFNAEGGVVGIITWGIKDTRVGIAAPLPPI